ncbi:uncharacterized protein [Miscanthus floridulus]|uniref:uncharacterized protein n=1 Tax=Miscanthus floridulus TaxID=154761 RepID=UPI0034585364
MMAGRGAGTATLESCKRKRGGRGWGIVESADIHIGREIAGKMGNSKKVVIGQTRRFGQVWTEMAASSFDEMGSKVKVANVSDAFGAASAMSMGDMFGKKHKKNTRKATDPPADVAPKRPRPTSVAASAPTRLASISTASPKSSSSQQQQGAASGSRVIVNVDYRTVGLLPGKVAPDFADACVGSFMALEVERDLLRVPNSSLVEAVISMLLAPCS